MTCAVLVFSSLINTYGIYSVRIKSVNDLSKLCQPQLA